MTTAADWYPKDLQSRPHDYRRTVIHPRLGYVDLVFCLSCGKGCGAVNTNCDSILVLCRDCAERHGGLPLPKLTDEDLERIGLANMKEGQ